MAAGSEGWSQLVMRALVDRGIVNAPSASVYIHPSLHPVNPLHHPPPSLRWHGRSSSLSHWLSVCWCGHLKSVSNVGRLPRDLEDTLINNHRATSLGESGTVRHCCIVLLQGVDGGGGCPWAMAVTQLSPSLLLNLFSVTLFVPGMKTSSKGLFDGDNLSWRPYKE